MSENVFHEKVILLMFGYMENIFIEGENDCRWDYCSNFLYNYLNLSSYQTLLRCGIWDTFFKCGISSNIIAF